MVKWLCNAYYRVRACFVEKRQVYVAVRETTQNTYSKRPGILPLMGNERGQARHRLHPFATLVRAHPIDGRIGIDGAQACL